MPCFPAPRRLLHMIPVVALPVLILTGWLAACAPTVQIRGNWVEPDLVQQLHPGSQSKADVAALLGAPGSTSTFDPNIWFYVGQRSEQRAFLRPEITGQQVLALSFDSQNRLEAYVIKGQDAYQDVVISRDATPTSGKKLTLLEQMIGNVGRFNSADVRKGK
jgi:outer membrane protein assembly factor BamE (lipoprotein component of BamABCDE complex)